tara:strand:+ start:441 stop:1004 length:564 start_codon:yes stop_codon:yes gene_type:complete
MNKKIDPLEVMQMKPQKSSAINNQIMPKVPFQDFFDEALNGINPNDVDNIEYNFNQKPRIVSEEENRELLAQALAPEEIDTIFREVENNRNRGQSAQNLDDEETYLSTNRMEVTPFQMLIDKAVEVLESISTMEYRVNDLTEQYIEGKVSLDEVSVETMKLNLAVSFATTVLSSATQTFKEITQLAI